MRNMGDGRDDDVSTISGTISSPGNILGKPNSDGATSAQPTKETDQPPNNAMQPGTDSGAPHTNNGNEGVEKRTSESGAGSHCDNPGSVKASAASWKFLVVSLAMSVVICGMAIGASIGFKRPDGKDAKKDLQTFVSHEKVKNNVDNVLEEDLSTDGFHRSAQSFCWGATSYDKAKSFLYSQLSDYPSEIRSSLMERVLVEGISQSNSIQDTTTKLSSSGKAHSYMAFWSSVHKPHNADAQYDTCLLYASIEIEVAEEIVDYKVEEKKLITGTEPCHCGYISCEQCPTYDVQTTKIPIFNRHTLSLKKQEELHRWLVRHAVDAAESIVGTAPNVGELPDNGAAPAGSWAVPALEASFAGETEL